MLPRYAADAKQCHALVIPGGESTVMPAVAQRSGLLPALLAFVQDPTKPVYGTCAGMILMASEDGIGGGKVIKGRPGATGWGGMDGLKVWRNLYGSESRSGSDLGRIISRPAARARATSDYR